jgi:diacylglycerol kinase (ATP)
MKPGEQGLTRIISATRYSWLGIKAAWRHEAAFRQELTIAVIGFPLAIWLARDAVEFLLLVVPLLLLMLIELVNSAIEAVVDRFGGELHELSGRAKDMGSAAVFMAIVITGLSWVAILANIYL